MDEDKIELAELFDLKILQAIMDDFYAITGIANALIDLDGKVLVGCGWQEICTKFHRVNPETLKNCYESDLALTKGVKKGEYQSYKCKNGLYDVVTPLYIADKHVANIFSGQFFFDDCQIDLKKFQNQAEKYGFDKADYIKALNKVPKVDRQQTLHTMSFLTKLTELISQQGLSNLKLSNALLAQKKVEEALRDSEERLKRSQEIAHLGSWELDLTKGKLTWSDEVYKIFGLKPQKFNPSYEAFLSHVHPEDRTAVDQAYSGSIEKVQEGYEIEHRVVQKNSGNIRIVHEKCTHIRDKSGKIIRSIGMVHDITERRKAEDEYKRAKEDWERTFDAVPDLIAILDTDYHILRANQAMATQLSIHPKEAVGLVCYECVHNANQSPDICPHALMLKDGKQHIAEVYEPRLGGQFMVSATPLFDSNGTINGSVHVARNITQLKKIEEALREAEKTARCRAEDLESIQLKLEEKAAEVEKYATKMEELAEVRLSQLKDSERLAAIGATAGMVGHDIRNPLQAIASDVYLAKADLSDIPEGKAKEGLKESLNGIEQNIDYINKIVQDLQDYARPLNPKRERTDLKHVIDNLIGNNGIPKNIKIQINIDETARQISVDAYYLNRILYNLVTNSIQAMPKGGELIIDVHKEKETTVISIQDTGIGIPKEIQGKMFTLMFTTKAKGQGFGLPVVKRMTESLGGTVTFESQEGKGTTFTVRLPKHKNV